MRRPRPKPPQAPAPPAMDPNSSPAPSRLDSGSRSAAGAAERRAGPSPRGSRLCPPGRMAFLPGPHPLSLSFSTNCPLRLTLSKALPLHFLTTEDLGREASSVPCCQNKKGTRTRSQPFLLTTHHAGSHSIPSHRRCVSPPVLGPAHFSGQCYLPAPRPVPSTSIFARLATHSSVSGLHSPSPMSVVCPQLRTRISPSEARFFEGLSYLTASPFSPFTLPSAGAVPSHPATVSGDPRLLPTGPRSCSCVDPQGATCAPGRSVIRTP